MICGGKPLWRNVFLLLENFDISALHYKKAIDLARKSLGEQHPNTKITLKNFEMTKEKLKNEKQ